MKRWASTDCWSRAVVVCALVALTVAVVVVVARAADQRARVLFVADGDTIRARLSDGSVRLIRFTGVQTMEMSHYAVKVRDARGACHAVQALRFVRRLLPVGRRVTLRAQHLSSQTGNRHRLRRLIIVGRTNVSLRLLKAGLALWLPNRTEDAGDAVFRRLAIRALRARVGLYDPFYCHPAPQRGLQPFLHVTVHGDAAGADGRNLNDEYVTVALDAAAPAQLNLSGWFVRNSALRYPVTKQIPGLPFPAGTILQPGGAFRVRVGCGPLGRPGEFDGSSLYWCLRAPMFENSGDGGYLFDPAGNLRGGYIY